MDVNAVNMHKVIELPGNLLIYCNLKFSYIYGKGKVKISLLQAMEAHRVARG
jgi:hypothetical protein